MDYLTSIEKAIEYIEEHLDEEILSADIAKAAGYSLYHLAHIFTAVAGEPMGSYIQKRRLSNACKKLVCSRQRVIDIAMESGFGSSEAFSRAFKSAYGISPAQYRKNNLNLYTGSKKMLDRETLLHIAENITRIPDIVELPALCVAGIRGETSTLNNALPNLWKRLEVITAPDSGLFHGRRIGICESHRSEVNILKDGNVIFSEIAGIEVGNFMNIPDSLIRKIIPGGRYAVFTHKGTVSALLKTYDYIWGSWVLFTKETLDEREDFEIYDERFLGADNISSQIDIYIPIK